MIIILILTYLQDKTYIQNVCYIFLLAVIWKYIFFIIFIITYLLDELIFKIFAVFFVLLAVISMVVATVFEFCVKVLPLSPNMSSSSFDKEHVDLIWMYAGWCQVGMM